MSARPPVPTRCIGRLLIQSKESSINMASPRSHHPHRSSTPRHPAAASFLLTPAARRLRALARRNRARRIKRGGNGDTTYGPLPRSPRCPPPSLFPRRPAAVTAAGAGGLLCGHDVRKTAGSDTMYRPVNPRHRGRDPQASPQSHAPIASPASFLELPLPFGLRCHRIISLFSSGYAYTSAHLWNNRQSWTSCSGSN